MNVDRLRVGERIAAVSAVLFFALTFLDWFGLKDSGELQLFSVGRSAWEALDYIPILLTITIVGVLVVVALRLINVAYESPFRPDAVIAILGTVSTLSILFRIVDPPNFGSFREVWGVVTIEGTAQSPIFFALLAAVGIAFGGYLAMWEGRGAG